AIGTKWVYRNKKDERGIVIRNKARLVAQGHTQEEGIDYEEVFAPVTRIEAIRLFLAYASFMGFPVYQMDVKSAFLYGNIEEEVYICQPPGFEDPEYPDKRGVTTMNKDDKDVEDVVKQDVQYVAKTTNVEVGQESILTKNVPECLTKNVNVLECSTKEVNVPECSTKKENVPDCSKLKEKQDASRHIAAVDIVDPETCYLYFLSPYTFLVLVRVAPKIVLRGCLFLEVIVIGSSSSELECSSTSELECSSTSELEFLNHDEEEIDEEDDEIDEESESIEKDDYDDELWSRKSIGTTSRSLISPKMKRTTSKSRINPIRNCIIGLANNKTWEMMVNKKFEVKKE
nr:copia protein [Tanacetum cinerariifolium]